MNQTFVLSLGNYIKDLSRLGRDIRKVIIIDNSPLSYLFHQDNAVCDKKIKKQNSICFC